MSTTLTTLLIAALLGGIIHTLAGPDHYLPFIAMAKSRRYNLTKTLMWTMICGIGHIVAALLLALAFIGFTQVISAAKIEWIEKWRGDLAAYSLIGLGAAMLVYALYNRWRKNPHSHKHAYDDGSTKIHTHRVSETHPPQNEKSVSYWMIFLIFVFGPCEALLPMLTASAIFGTLGILLTAIIFSLTTIATMLLTVTIGYYGWQTLRFNWLEKYPHEIAGATLMMCGMAIAFLGL